MRTIATAALCVTLPWALPTVAPAHPRQALDAGAGKAASGAAAAIGGPKAPSGHGAGVLHSPLLPAGALVRPAAGATVHHPWVAPAAHEPDLAAAARKPVLGHGRPAAAKPSAPPRKDGRAPVR
jgi:hypothetical protein